MKDKDLEKLINGGRSMYESALALLVCLFGASLILLIAFIINQ
jgi:hypothetical protein